MADEQLFQVLARWSPWGAGPFKTGIAREAAAGLLAWVDRPEILAICGIRRGGKSTLMRQLARSVIDRGTPERDVLFVDFEDPFFLGTPRNVDTLDRVFATYRELGRPEGVPYLFLDEVQNIDGWARWVRAMVETDAAHITVSGSSSRLLEPDLAAVLTGRNVTWTLWPLSFREYLRFQGLELADPAEWLAHGARVRQALERYLRFGGLPEVALTASEDTATVLLKQLFRDILYRDIVSRHEVRDVRALESLAHHCLVNTGNLLSYNRLKNAYGYAMDQVRSYLAYLAECYLVREMPRYFPKLSSQERAPRKVYAVDTGLRNAVAFRFSSDAGRLAETLVHNHLVRDEELRLFYWKGKGECDFVLWRGEEAIEALQVAYDPRDELAPRELSGLREASEALGVPRARLVTHGLRDDVVREDGGPIALRPLWTWLLEGR